jgi:hypothetical protein
MNQEKNQLKARMEELEKAGINRRQIAALLHKKRLQDWKRAKSGSDDQAELKGKSRDSLYSTVTRVIDDPDPRQYALVKELVEIMGGFMPYIEWLPVETVQEEINKLS